LGFIVSTQGIQVDPEKVTTITQWGVPRTVKGVQAFLRFCNFYRRFIQDYGRIAKPLNQLTRKGQVFNWDQHCQSAVETLKSLLTKAPIWQHYHSEHETMVETDASDGVVSGVLSQKQKDNL